MAKQTAGRPIPQVPTGPPAGTPTGQGGDSAHGAIRPTPAHGQGHGGPAGHGNQGGGDGQ